MSAATYGTEDVNATIAGRGTSLPSLQRPFQIFIISGDFLLILLSYLAAGILYREFMGSPADQEVPIGAGLIVGLAFVTIAFFQGVYNSHRLLNGILAGAQGCLRMDAGADYSDCRRLSLEVDGQFVAGHDDLVCRHRS